MATGVLPLVLNRATRLAQFYLKCDKRYEATVRFGYATDTYDREGTPLGPPVDVRLEAAQIEKLLDDFRGPLIQKPPMISAKKVAGTPAYKLARRQLPVDLKPVDVMIYSLELLACEKDAIRIRVHCSAGTYLRTLAHELGQRLGCGAFVEHLRRTASGDFTLSEAHTLAELEDLASQGRLAQALVPAAQLLPAMPNEVVDTITAGQIRQGRDFRVSPFRIARGAKYVKAIGPDGQLIAIGEAKLPHLYHPILVL